MRVNIGIWSSKTTVTQSLFATIRATVTEMTLCNLII